MKNDKRDTTTATVRRETMKKIKMAALKRELYIVDYIDWLVDNQKKGDIKTGKQGDDKHGINYTDYN